MAKTSQVARQKKRQTAVALHRERRAELKKKIADPKIDVMEKLEFVRRLDELPRDGSRTRLRNRCRLTGRSRAYIRRFGLSRIKFRELASRGELPGVTKSSW
jgi:small subunit ribosomal protein S14